MPPTHEGKATAAGQNEILNTLQDLSTRLDVYFGEKGRISNIEEDVATQKKLIDDHERQIQRANGGIGVLLLLGGALEFLIHKFWFK